MNWNMFFKPTEQIRSIKRVKNVVTFTLRKNDVHGEAVITARIESRIDCEGNKVYNYVPKMQDRYLYSKAFTTNSVDLIRETIGCSVHTMSTIISKFDA